MLYEYECEDGHVIEAHVKLNGEGAPTACTVHIPISPMCDTEPAAIPVVCGKKLKKLISLGSPYFPGAGGWRGA